MRISSLLRFNKNFNFTRQINYAENKKVQVTNGCVSLSVHFFSLLFTCSKEGWWVWFSLMLRNEPTKMRKTWSCCSKTRLHTSGSFAFSKLSCIIFFLSISKSTHYAMSGCFEVCSGCFWLFLVVFVRSHISIEYIYIYIYYIDIIYIYRYFDRINKYFHEWWINPITNELLPFQKFLFDFFIDFATYLTHMYILGTICVDVFSILINIY